MKMTGCDGNLLELGGKVDGKEAGWSSAFASLDRILNAWVEGLSHWNDCLFVPPSLVLCNLTRKTGILSFPCLCFRQVCCGGGGARSVCAGTTVS